MEETGLNNIYINAKRTVSEKKTLCECTVGAFKAVSANGAENESERIVSVQCMYEKMRR